MSLTSDAMGRTSTTGVMLRGRVTPYAIVLAHVAAERRARRFARRAG